MAVEAGVGAHRLFEVDFAGGVEAGGLVEAFGRDLDMESPRLGLEADDGHAGARQGDAVAEGDVVEKARRRLDRERLAEGRAGAERLRFDDAADAADDAGEHGSDCRRRAGAPASRRRQRRRRKRRSAPTRRHVDDAEIEALLEPLERPERGQAPAAAEQARRDVDEQLVDPAFLQQRGIELLAGLDMQLVDAARAEVGEHRGEIDLAAGRRQQRDLGAACFQLAPPGDIVDRRVEQHRSRRGEDARRRRRLQARIDDDAQRLAGGGHEPHVEPRIVVENGADAGQQGTGTLAPGMAVVASRLAGDPLADAVVERAATVERDRGLEAQPRPAALHARDEADVELARFLLRRARGRPRCRRRRGVRRPGRRRADSDRASPSPPGRRRRRRAHRRRAACGRGASRARG